jgi:hypothetical protein
MENYVWNAFEEIWSLWGGFGIIQYYDWMDFILGDLAYENDYSTFKDLANHLGGYIF